MSATRYGRPFQPLNSTAPSFNSTLGSSGVYAIASTLRVFNGPTNRAVRVSSIASDDMYITFGTSLIAPSTLGLLILGGTVESFYIAPYQAYIAIKSSTDVTLNITPGYGG